MNDGTINLYGDAERELYATLHTAGAFTNDGSVNLFDDIDKLAGPVSGTGDFSLSNLDAEFREQRFERRDRDLRQRPATS